MYRLFLILFLLFPASIHADGSTVQVQNQRLGYSFFLPASWHGQKQGESGAPVVFHGQEFDSAYWKDGQLGDGFPYILVHSVNTGKVSAKDMTGLNKIAVQTTLDGMGPGTDPKIMRNSFDPYKALLSFTVEFATVRGEPALLSKYVYYTENGVLEFSLYCGGSDTDALVDAGIALSKVKLASDVRYVPEVSRPALFSLLNSPYIYWGMIVALVAAAAFFLLAWFGRGRR